MDIANILKFFSMVNIWKTFYFNFHYFPFTTAIHLPIFVCRNTRLYKIGGRIVIDAPVKTGMVHFGAHYIGIKDAKFPRTTWEVSGELVIKGQVRIGHGSKICIEKEGKLTLGDGLLITGNVEMVCTKEIYFGNDCMLSWDVLMMDSDLHDVLSEDGMVMNPPKSINIGNHVWIGCRSTILKGVSIADNNVISAGSLVTRSIPEMNCIIGGHGKSLEILKRNVNWRQ